MALLFSVLGCTRTVEKPSPTVSKLPEPPTPTPVATWVYQLQSIDLSKIAQSPGGLVVIDPSRNGDGDSAGFWDREEIERLRGSGKLVLAYLSIGEAENYRDYWKEEWDRTPPEFLGGPNPDWPDNFPVKYWNKEWQEVMLARVDRIKKAGFDGVFLDKVDAFEDWEELGGSVELKKEMAKFISQIKKRGGFQVYLQNGWAVWQEPELAGSVDGVAIEEFSLGWEGTDGAATPTEIKKEMQQALETANQQGWALLVVDYPSPDSPPSVKESALEEARRVGAVPLLAPRDLDG